MSNIKKFDDVLDNCLERLLVKDETIEQCLQSFPEHSDELKPLLEMAMATRQVSTIEPRPEFREQARYRFQTALRETGQKKSRPLFNWGWQPRWVTTAAIALIVFITGGGTLAAASGSMPDNFLYPVKLVTEQVQVAFTFSRLDKAELHAQIADKRVTEIVYLAAKGKPGKILSTTDNLNVHLAEISVLVSSPETTSGIAMAPAVAVQEAEVERVIPAAEEATVKQFSVTEERLEAKDMPAPAEARAIPAPPPTVIDVQEEPARADEPASLKANPRAELKTKVANQASNNIARLRALLETVTESARPALLRAIAVSENGYQKAIESLGQP
ncbi:MAG: DUF5667 domain-containing protein [Dehalococcoidales bacterium]